MALAALKRLKNPSQIFSKDGDSASNSSLPSMQNGNHSPLNGHASYDVSLRSPAGGVPGPNGLAMNGYAHALNGHMNGHMDEELKPPSMPAAKEGKMSLRKRFFSGGGPPKAEKQNAKPVLENGDVKSLTRKGKLELFKLADGKIDLVVLLYAIQERFAQQFEEARLEMPRQHTRYFPAQKEQYQWAEPSNAHLSYPPHLANIPKEARASLINIFDLSRLIEAAVSMVPEVPNGISSLLYGEPIGDSMSKIEARMARLSKQGGNIGSMPSIGNRADWFHDAVFSQQSFTGSNPTTITKASPEWLKRFMSAANMQGNKGMYTLLSTTPTESMFIQDCSYFRIACNAEPDSTLCSEDGRRYGCASVTLLSLSPEGKLHPLAIVLDYRVSMENSVCIFNRRLGSEDSSKHEAIDWPWRYAKLCAQVSDWTRHEVAAHLTDCHFVQEALVVAAQRSFPTDHVVFNLLAPHWAKTLSINAAAREVVVPEFMTQMNGFSVQQTHAFIMDAYKRFHFTARYVPTDLSRRGFPCTPTPLNNAAQFRNYVWAKNISMLWVIIRKFVARILATVYKCDDGVVNEKHTQSWCAEMHSQTGGQMSSFPDITTLDKLADAVTMCIHIASPLHNSVNHLQGYYQSFVPNKPACLSSPLPRKLSELTAYTEKDFVKALPVKSPRVWRMCEQLPHLLSSPIDSELSMVAYARNVEVDAKEKKGPRWEMVGDAAIMFGEELLEADIMFKRNSEMMDDCVMPYRALDPEELAISIIM